MASVVALVRMLARHDATDQAATAGAKTAKIALVVLAIIGAFALIGAAAMAIMHLGMMGCCN